MLIGYKTPCGSHIRRMNPRDADVAGVVRIHRMIRRGTSYGPSLPEGVLEDDGVERGLMFAFVGAHLGRQFEFVQSEWMNDSAFFGGASGRDPVAGDRKEPESLIYPGGHCECGCKVCLGLWLHEAASTASSLACAPCDGWRNSRHSCRDAYSCESLVEPRCCGQLAC